MNKFKTYLFIASATVILSASSAFQRQAIAQIPSPVYTVPKEPFQKEVIILFIAGKQEGFGSFLIPKGKRLIIEHVSACIALPSGQKILEARIDVLQAGGGAQISHYLNTFFAAIAPNGDYFSVSHSLRLYAVGDVRFAFFRTDKISIGQVNATVSGYLVDL